MRQRGKISGTGIFLITQIMDRLILYAIKQGQLEECTFWSGRWITICKDIKLNSPVHSAIIRIMREDKISV